MRALLRPDGSATIPPSVSWAKRRLADLDYEVSKRIERQLVDPNRTDAEWKSRAETALEWLVKEAGQRREWLAAQPEPEPEDYEAFWRQP